MSQQHSFRLLTFTTSNVLWQTFFPNICHLQSNDLTQLLDSAVPLLAQAAASSFTYIPTSF